MNEGLYYEDVFRCFPETIKKRIIEKIRTRNPILLKAYVTYEEDCSYLETAFVWANTNEGTLYWDSIAKEAMRNDWYRKAFEYQPEKVIIEI